MAARGGVTLWGDWERAEDELSTLPIRMRGKIIRVLREEAEAVVRRLKANLYSGRYAQAWPPLTASWAATKRRKGLDPRLLIAEGTYVKAITAIRVGPYEWGVGVEDPELAAIGRAHEFGYPAKQLPARPHYRVELERMRTGGYARVREAVLAIINGEV